MIASLSIAAIGILVAVALYIEKKARKQDRIKI